MPLEPVAHREQIVERLLEHRHELARLDVSALALFGSAARDGLGPESDVDMLVEFGHAPSFDRYMDLKLFLEDLLGRRIDLVTRGALKPGLHARIVGELVHVA